MKPLRTIRNVVVLLAALASTCAAGGMSEEKLLSLLNPDRPVDRRILDAHTRVEISPDDPEAHIALGNAYRDGALLDLALMSYGRATRLDPGNSIAWNNRGLVQQLTRRWGDAIGSFRKAVKSDPRNAEARYNLAHAIARTGNFQAAVEQMRLALLVNPDLGEIDMNPRSFGSRLLLPTRMELYQQSVSAAAMPAMRETGESGLSSPVDAPWLGGITLRDVPAAVVGPGRGQRPPNQTGAPKPAGTSPEPPPAPTSPSRPAPAAPAPVKPTLPGAPTVPAAGASGLTPAPANTPHVTAPAPAGAPAAGPEASGTQQDAVAAPAAAPMSPGQPPPMPSALPGAAAVGNPVEGGAPAVGEAPGSDPKGNPPQPTAPPPAAGVPGYPTPGETPSAPPPSPSEGDQAVPAPQGSATPSGGVEGAPKGDDKPDGVDKEAADLVPPAHRIRRGGR